ncbi:MAG: hypothetical protein IT350_06920 [Deltaproteobacteria bacterium]|nr:hypothetical protein [Deltaproteobacteria bacterium]
MARAWIHGFCLILLLAAGCGESIEGTPPDPDYDVLMSAGKQALEDGQGDDAYVYFEEADRVRPGDAQANFGLVLADVLQIVNFADQGVNFAGALSPDESGAAAKSAVKSGSDSGDHGSVADEVAPGPGRVIQMFIDQIFDDHLDLMIGHIDTAIADDSLTFEVGSIPLRLQGEEFLVFSGTWDRADILFIDAVTRFLRGGIDMALAVDLNFDFAALMDFMNLDADSMDADEYNERLLHMIEGFLTDPEFPNFLLANPQAEWRMPRAGLAFGQGALHLAEALATVSDPDGPLGYDDANGNGARDTGEAYILGNLDPMSDGLMMWMPLVVEMLNLAGASFWDETELDIDPEASNAFDLSALNDVWPDDFVLPPILPTTSIDLGAFFRNPDANAFKDALTDIVVCLDYPGTIFDTLACLTH